MAVAGGAPWQLECEKMEQRCGYVLMSGQWSDCTFMVGSENNQTAISAHKFVLALVSPVFEAMLYGDLSERNDPIVPIPDIQPEVFRALLQYIYTGHTDISSFDMAWDLWYGAKKYMLPQLEKECNVYICSVLGPKNACRAYEFACLFDDKTIMDKCMKIISKDTKEVLNDSSFEDVALNTLITVCSLDYLNVDNELDLFNAVARYAKGQQKRQGQFSAPEAEGTRSKLLQSVESSSSIIPVAELGSKQPSEVVTSEPTVVQKELKKTEEPEPTIRAALQKIRFLSLTATQFAEGPALSDFLTKEESFAVFMNIASTAGLVAMPTGFSECREPRNNSTDQCLETCGWEPIIKALKCGIPSRVKEAVEAAVEILRKSPIRENIQQALDKDILDALIPALTEGNETGSNDLRRRCQFHAARAIYYISGWGSPSQLRVLPEAAVLQPFCRLLTAGGDTCWTVLCGLEDMLHQERLELNTRHALLLKLRDIGVPQLLATVVERDEENRSLANRLLRDHFAE